MSVATSFRIWVHITDFNNANIPLGNYGEKQGPIIEAAKKALEELGGNLLSGEYGPSPKIYPPVYIVFVETTPVEQEDLQKTLVEIWPSIKTEDDQPVPKADIRVDTVE